MTAIVGSLCVCASIRHKIMEDELWRRDAKKRLDALIRFVLQASFSCWVSRDAGKETLVPKWMHAPCGRVVAAVIIW